MLAHCCRRGLITGRGSGVMHDRGGVRVLCMIMACYSTLSAGLKNGSDVMQGQGLLIATLGCYVQVLLPRYARVLCMNRALKGELEITVLEHWCRRGLKRGLRTKRGAENKLGLKC